MSDKKKMSKKELEQAQGGTISGPLHDHPGTEPVPQQRRKPFGKASVTGMEGEGSQKPGDPLQDSPVSDS